MKKLLSCLLLLPLFSFASQNESTQRDTAVTITQANGHTHTFRVDTLFHYLRIKEKNKLLISIPILVNAEDNHQEYDLLMDDFNFDGNKDIAIPRNFGFGGVNVYYDIYVYKPSRNKYVMLRADNSDWVGFSNIHVDTAKKEIHTMAYSAGRNYLETYRYENDKLYRSLSVVGLFDAMKGEERDGIYFITSYNSKSQVIEKVLSELPDRYMPVRRTLAKNMFLYDAPDETTKTQSYLMEGNIVELLDEREDKWYQVKYTSQKGAIIKWIYVQ